MTSEEPISFADLLRQFRRMADLTQEELAERAHLSTRAISALEQGQNHGPRRDTVALLAEALALTPSRQAQFREAARAIRPREAPLAMDAAPEPAHPHNLPLTLTSFVGRELQQSGVRRLLQRPLSEGGYRLVTLTGAGGTGKTRLALRVATDLIADYPDGVWMVELASLLDHALVPKAVATVVGMSEQAGRPLFGSLLDALRPKHLLLVLDNCEHLVAACGELISALLRACPHLSVLATSREPLRIPGEAIWQVPTLAVPDPAKPLLLEEFTRCESVQLFVERARALLPTFAVVEEDMPAIAQICRRLDGIPLALELAAARTSVLSVEQIAARLDNCFELLTGGARTVVNRQRTLKAAMDWSFALLSPREQLLFGRLSVFAGGFGLDAVEAVCGGPDLPKEAILNLLSSLLDKSLILTERHRGAARYRLLEPMRQYAARILEQSGDLATPRRRHRDWFLHLAECAETQLWTAEQREWLTRLETEHDNLRAALDFCVTTTGESETGLLLARALWQFWLLRGHFADGRHWLESLLRVTRPDAPRRAEVFLHACALAARRDAAAAADLADQGIAVYIARNDQRGRVRAMHLRGMIAWLQFDYPLARALFEEALALAEAKDFAEEAALLTHSVGFICWWQGDIERARALMEASLRRIDRFRDGVRIASSFLHLGWMPIDDQSSGPTEMTIENSLLLLREIGAQAVTAHILANLSNLARCERDHERAGRLLGESLAIFQRIGDRMGIAQVLGQLGNLARVRGDHAQARSHLDTCLALRQEIGESRGIANALISLGTLALAEGDNPRAGSLVAAGLTAIREIQDRPAIAWTTASHAALTLRAGDLHTARALYQDLAVLYQNYGAEPHGQALSLAGLGLIAKHEREYPAARSRLEASLLLWRQVGDRRSCAALLYQLGEVERLR
ncbi:MAG TPA: tetratricopeptide repeat protein [Chloroflexota bacterium]|nr:tetratricopeptide repeat protein [Chloroflexota bacterium]